jgi:hypothetical protein
MREDNFFVGGLALMERIRECSAKANTAREHTPAKYR